MATVATEKYRLSHLVKEALWPEKGYTYKQVTVNDAAQTLAIGTVLGKVSANGKFKVAVETANDGTKVGAAIVVEEVTIPATTDTLVTVMFRGPSEVSKGALVLHSTYDNNTKKNTLYADLEALGIQVSDAV